MSVARMRRPTGLLAALILLAGCARGGHAGGSAPGNAGADQPSVRDFIAAWDEAIGQRNGPAFIVTSPLQDQVGTWSMAEGAHNKEAVLSGRVVAGPGVIAARAPATGTVRPSGQPPKKVPVITAAQAVRAIAAAGSPSGPCDQGCAPLALAHARLVTSRVSTTAGPLDVPTWSFEVPGSKVRITRVAIDTTALIVPPAIAGGPAAVGAQTETAVLSGPTGVTVTFAGASTSDPPCGQTYTATAVESKLVVAVVIAGTGADDPAPADTACPASAALRTVEVTLAAPLDHRLIIDGSSGGVITLNR